MKKGATNKLSVTIGRLRLENPVMVASGTFGYAEEFADFIDLKKLGAVVSKTITVKPRQGNPMPRTCETPAGLLNSIGLENPGIEAFISLKLPFFKKIGTPLIVSIASEGDTDEFIFLAKRLNRIDEVAGIELNISCPNIVHAQKSVVRSTRKSPCRLPTTDRGLVSQDPKATYDVVRKVRAVTRKPLITKLSPNVTSISEIALAAQEAGSDAVALINTLLGMSIDVDSRKPKIARVTAGLSGPAIRPVAIRLVWEVFQSVSIPIIGMGGISDGESALEFFIAGASAISVGTANFIDPQVTLRIIDDIKRYLKRHSMKNIAELKGSLAI